MNHFREKGLYLVILSLLALGALLMAQAPSVIAISPSPN